MTASRAIDALPDVMPAMSREQFERWVDYELDRCWPWLDAALATSPIRTHEKGHIRERLLTGECQLWPTSNSASIAEERVYPTGARVLFGWLAGGDLDEIKMTARQIEDHARCNGFDGVGTQGRRGWVKAFEGYVDAGSTVVKVLR